MHKYRDFKERRELIDLQNKLNLELAEHDIKDKNRKAPSKLDKRVFDDGVTWFNSGLSLDDADESVRSDYNFVNGFNHAKRLERINSELEGLGSDWFYSGQPLENASKNYVNNAAFIKGYNDAKNQSQHKGL